MKKIDLLVENYKQIFNKKMQEFDIVLKGKSNLMDFITREVSDGLVIYGKIDFTNWCQKTEQLLKNKYDINYLNQVCHEEMKINNNKWNYFSNHYHISEILQKTLLIRTFICENNFGLPVELWDIICNYIERDIYFYVPKCVVFNTKILLHLNTFLCFDLCTIFKNNNGDCHIDPVNILKYINVNDFIARGSKLKGYDFSVIIDIDIQHKLITILTYSCSRHYPTINREELYKRNNTWIEVEFNFKNDSITKLLNFYDFLFMYGISCNDEVYLHKSDTF